MNSPAQLSSPGAVLKILIGSHKGKQFRLLSSEIIIGRHSDCDIIFKDNPLCSRKHARIKREGTSYLIESLNPENLVLVNKRTVRSHLLKPKDKITIGDIELLFLDKAPVKSSLPQSLQAFETPKSKKSWLTPPRAILLAILIGGLGLHLSKNKKNSETQGKLDLRTEKEIMETVKEIEKLNKEEEEKALKPQEKEARIAFIKGFRDYRKGYFQRALKMFQHCLTFNKKDVLCERYSEKSKIQIERLIQKKIRLGNIYKEKKQYEACQAVFKSVEIMIQDTGSILYKEASANKKLCETHLKNKI